MKKRGFCGNLRESINIQEKFRDYIDRKVHIVVELLKYRIIIRKEGCKVSEKGNFVKFRINEEQAECLNRIVNELQGNTPESSVTMSSVARYAVEKYLKEYEETKSGKRMYFWIDFTDASGDDIRYLYELLSEVFDRAKRSDTNVVLSMLVNIMAPIMKKAFDTSYRNPDY